MNIFTRVKRLVQKIWTSRVSKSLHFVFKGFIQWIWPSVTPVSTKVGDQGPGYVNKMTPGSRYIFSYTKFYLCRKTFYHRVVTVRNGGSTVKLTRKLSGKSQKCPTVQDLLRHTLNSSPKVLVPGLLCGRNDTHPKDQPTSPRIRLRLTSLWDIGNSTGTTDSKTFLLSVWVRTL